MYHNTINDGLEKLKKYYTKFDEKPAYVLSLGKLTSGLLPNVMLTKYSPPPIL